MSAWSIGLTGAAVEKGMAATPVTANSSPPVVGLGSMVMRATHWGCAVTCKRKVKEHPLVSEHQYAYSGRDYVLVSASLHQNCQSGPFLPRIVKHTMHRFSRKNGKGFNMSNYDLHCAIIVRHDTIMMFLAGNIWHSL
jgi:hypothetical protein